MADERGRKSLARKSKKRKISRPENDEEPQTCVICLDKVSCRGKLGVCQHWFCFTCILEWSKNTNTCPVCKMKFRCISKIHLVPGQSPVKQVRVKDVDQRIFQDDEDFIWAELESSHSEEDLSQYEPPSQDDVNDNTFYPFIFGIDSDELMVTNSDEHTDQTTDGSCSNGYFDTYFDAKTSSNEDEMSGIDFLIHSESETKWSPVFQRKSARRTIVSDSEDSSDAETDDEWRSKKRHKKSYEKKTVTSGFHRNHQKPQKSTNQKFEAELERRKHTVHSQTNTKKKKSTTKKDNHLKETEGARRGGRSTSSKGRWLRTASAGSKACSSQSISRSRQRPTRIADSDEETSDVSMESTQTESSSSRDESGSARNGTNFTRNESISPRTRRQKRRALTIEDDSDTDSSDKISIQPSLLRWPKGFESDSESSGESWIPHHLSVSERLRQNTNSKKSENKRRHVRSSRVLKEVQNFSKTNIR